MARIISFMIIVTLARHNYQEQNGYNATIPCVLHAQDSSLGLYFDIRLLIVPRVINSLSVISLVIGGIEYITSQTPYSMRGLICGVVYGSIALYSVIGYGIMQAFASHVTSWSTGLISCGFWYMLFNLILILVIGFVLSVVWKCYKMRKREDVLPNEQIFAERYYDRSY